MAIQGNMIFNGHLLVVLAAVRTKLMPVTHDSHVDSIGYLRRMHEYLYWPRMTTQVTNYVPKCDTCTCMSHSSATHRVNNYNNMTPWRGQGPTSAQTCAKRRSNTTHYNSANYLKQLFFVYRCSLKLGYLVCL